MPYPIAHINAAGDAQIAAVVRVRRDPAKGTTTVRGFAERERGPWPPAVFGEAPLLALPAVPAGRLPRIELGFHRAARC